MSQDNQSRLTGVACSPHGRAVLLLAAVLLGAAGQAAHVQVEATGLTDNTFVTSGDPCGTGQSGGNACNGQEINIRLVIDTGAAPADQDDAGNRGSFRRTVAPGFITGSATIGGRKFAIPRTFQFSFDQSVEISDDLDGSSLGFVALDRVQFGISGGNAQESFAVSPNLLMSSGAFTGDLLEFLGTIAGSPLAFSGLMSLSNGSFNFTNATGQVQGQYRISQVAFSILAPVRLLGLSDIDNDGVKDLAALRADTNLVELRGGMSGALLGTIGFFNSAYTPVSAVAIPDCDGNGVPEIALLAARKSDFRGVVEIRNVTGAQAARQIWFVPGHRPSALAVITGDADNNGTPELAVLSRRNSDGRGLVEVKNAHGATNPQSIWVGAGLTPGDVETVEDADKNGVPEVAILSSRNSDGRIVVEVKNAAGVTNSNSVWFTPGNAPVDLTVVNDADGNAVPEVAVLSSRKSDGRNVVEVKNAVGATNPSAVWFAAGHSALAVKQVSDADGNSVPEVAVLSKRNSDGRVLVEVKNAAGATNSNALWYPAGFTARDLAILKDVDGNAIEEAGVLLTRASDGRIVVETRNASGAQGTKDYWFKP